MTFLALSNDSKDLLPLTLERDNWHHTMHKFDLYLGENKLLNRDRYDESIKGVLYVAYNPCFVRNRCLNNINKSKCIVYPSVSKLTKAMDRLFLFRKIFKELKGDKCIDYPWFYNDKGCCDSWADDFKNYDIFCNNITNGHFVVRKDYDYFEDRIINYTELANTIWFDYGFVVQKLPNKNNYINIIFIGAKFFSYIEKDSENDFTYTVSKEIIALARKIKKITGIAFINIKFVIDEDKCYFHSVKPFPKLPVNKRVKGAYIKKKKKKMEYVERKVKEKEL